MPCEWHINENQEDILFSNVPLVFFSPQMLVKSLIFHSFASLFQFIIALRQSLEG